MPHATKIIFLNMTACLCSICRARRHEYIVDGDGKHEPEKKSFLKAELTISNQYSKWVNFQTTTPSDWGLWKILLCGNQFHRHLRAVFTHSNSSNCIWILYLDSWCTDHCIVISHSRSPNERTQTYSSDVRTDERADWQNADSKQ